MGGGARQLRERYLALKAQVNAAMEYFQEQTPSGFAAAKVQIHDGLQEMSSTTEMFKTQREQLDFIVGILDLQASAYLPLVADMDSQRAYAVLVESFGRKAVEGCFHTSGALMQFSGQSTQEQEIAKRVQYWITEGYRKFASKTEPTQSESQETETVDALPDADPVRAQLLTDYKLANGNISNKRIYEARNSGIHKPQFYEWLKGDLPRESETTRNFERFLREKKPPIPRTPKP